ELHLSLDAGDEVRRLHRALDDEVHSPGKFGQPFGVDLQPGLIDFGSALLVQAGLADVAHDSNDLSPGLAGAGKANPLAERVARRGRRELSSNNVIVDDYDWWSVSSILGAEVAPCKQPDTKGLVVALANRLAHGSRPIGGPLRLGLALYPVAVLTCH